MTLLLALIIGWKLRKCFCNENRTYCYLDSGFGKNEGFLLPFIWCKSRGKVHKFEKNYTSYFLSFESGARLELMHIPTIPLNQNDVIAQYMGFIHFAMAVGSEAKVDELTERLRSEGYKIIGEPRRTGDGYYESVVLDPENNRIEITV
jgi:lactoylglutathione lyase